MFLIQIEETFLRRSESGSLGDIPLCYRFPLPLKTLKSRRISDFGFYLFFLFNGLVLPWVSFCFWSRPKNLPS